MVRDPIDVFGNWSLVIDPCTFSHVRGYSGDGTLVESRYEAISTVNPYFWGKTPLHVQQMTPKTNGVANYRFHTSGRGCDFDGVLEELGNHGILIRDGVFREAEMSDSQLALLVMIYPNYVK